ncbi:GcvT family protein [Sulfitobacter sp. M57]|uniref:GcvT family protein n=1 Tax=unclassified Sulfitobacter TaxID=196795 RepID=UPI0023E30B18|nr:MULTISPECIES: FAD-dependent oxidoreductase [unclassified Sulfitobacter]MDF3415479.1 GcvT family protein [Sulfitobacter sp. KE5]MDF3422960.1 GcvT family protein [Sulfitobacter sp. KE43]MDF3434025.1 GcvT family protein [Sulfitobacter sp. KE42]MDF3459942.1 GcvT family protein [Sulfitobacter sp. S74]MDF3463564.1 GcvT family protein [Sulfitobacter sp. Ks18]
MTLPSSSKIIIIGGGIIGCSTAYHLAQMGHDVLLLEKAQLTSGSTWHAAGLVGQLRSSANITQLLGYSIELYNKLEAETGLATGWKMNGGLRLACNQERWTEVKRQATTAHSFGLDMQLLTPQEAQDLWPLMDIGDVVGAAFLPTDGQASPSDITQALAKGARAKGAQLLENTPVTEILTEKGKIVGVRTPQGDITCEKLVLCCGQWTRTLAKSIGVTVPLVSVEHQYMITEAFGVPSDLPTLRDPDRLTYYKEEVGGLVMGGYEPNGIPWAKNGIPDPFDFQLLDSNFDHFEQLVELALPRVPALETTGIKQLINGPESFTPDGNFILGEAPEMANVFVGAGFNAFGIASGGGAGMALAEWVAKGEPPYDLWPVDIRRFGRPHTDEDWVRARTMEAYGKHYTMAWPSEEHSSGRPCRRSPLYAALQDSGAVFGEKLGWERPNWFAEAGEDARDIYTFDRPNWHAPVAREHKAAREAAVLFDQTSFAKFILKGPDAEEALNWIAANRVDKPVGGIIYTQMLNDHGGIECDLTCVRTAEDEYYIVTGTGFATHDFDWISRNIPKGMNAQLVDVTSSNAVLSLFGPKARDILEQCTRDDVSHVGFAFGQARTIGIAGCPVLALRITYVGELGWELHLPTEYALTVFAALHEAGAHLGLRNAGYRAIETLRLEKGYRAWSSDIGPDHTPDEAGLGWAVKMKSNIPFKGREAVQSQRESGVKKIMATFTCDGEVILSGRETIYRNGERCGWLSSAGYGHTLGESIGMGYVRSDQAIDKEYVLSGDYELEVATHRVKAKVTLAPLYDPKMAKVKS